MADNEDIAFKLDVDMGNGAQSLSSLKQEFKALQKELENTNVGSKEYIETMKKLGKTKDEIGDLRNEINALNPEGKVRAFGELGNKLAGGFEAATGAAALFGNKSEEVEKSLLKVQAALALQQGIKEVAGLGDAFKEVGLILRANPLMLIATVIIGIGAALYALKDKIGIVGDAFEAIGKVISYIGDKITEFTDMVGLSNSKLSEMGDELTASIEKSTEALAEQTQEYDNQIAVAKASGKSAVDLEIAKQKAIIDTNKALVEQTIAYVQAGGELDEERAKLLTNQLKSIKQATVQIEVIEAESNKKKLDDYKKYLEDKNKAAEKNFEEYKKQYADDDAEQRRIIQERNDWIHQEAIRLMNNLREVKEEEKAFADADLMEGFNRIQADNDAVKKSEEDKRAEKQQTFNTTVSTAKLGLQATQALTDLYYAHQLKMAKGNAAQETAIRKKQFNVNKAFGVANSIIDGVGAIQKALNNPYPLNIILAVLTGVLATANTIKIATAKFDDGGAGGSGGDVGSVGTTASAPVIPQPNNTVTKISDDGKVQNANTKPESQRVYVVETDISKSNKRVANIEETAKIG